ncbi:PREDICTED: U11/U12 small nuclear ribonucleoprotein 35 kDa protein-like isoform X2 [Wasmannia auropunctata]|uniref:U11/U12 small nuclear ribonucleoprotein 35 kDa protein-like isoform X2 n=1 Tax=Wasmannia auropunctata TaxID=64793 RepID=UPI0005F0B580|nr:PREDICTED: U11/U12 small nuclear ribonucleoprotein 35 kDa protein-like isoform X2 [Wasmannia auropunctata]
MGEDVLQNWSPYAKEYNPLKAGSIDGTDTQPHDKAVSRAMLMHYEPPHNLESKVERTIFVARLGPKITNYDLKEVIVNVVTGLSQGYGFVEMKSEEEARRVLRRTTDATLKGYKIFIDYECGRSMKGWKPRRLGGGFGGKKESGQLRFGGKDRPFKRPIVPNVLKPKR